MGNVEHCELSLGPIKVNRSFTTDSSNMFCGLAFTPALFCGRFKQQASNLAIIKLSFSIVAALLHFLFLFPVLGPDSRKLFSMCLSPTEVNWS